MGGINELMMELDKNLSNFFGGCYNFALFTLIYLDLQSLLEDSYICFEVNYKFDLFSYGFI